MIHSTILVLVLVFLALRVAAIELVANYRLWDSVSSQIIYDYSGNSRHGKYSQTNFNPVYTDRGMTTFSVMNIEVMKLTSNPVQGYSELALSLWAFRINASSYMHTYINRDQDFYSMTFYFYDSYTTVGSYSSNNFSYNLAPITGWNLFTTKLYSNPADPINPTQMNLNVYSNLNYLKSFTATFLPVKAFHIQFELLIIYEIWVHTGLASLNDLNYLIYNNCPTSPSNLCLPGYGRFQNKNGDVCPSGCSSNNLSCDRNQDCIQHDKSSCFYGLYQLESGGCIFYCPDDSCICSLTFQCSCKEGFKKIYDEFVGCVPNYWASYHQEGNIYVFDTLDVGYSVDSNGNCCICEEDYIAVSTSPLNCIYIPNCLAYTKVGADYFCSNCKEGYRINSEGQCLECSEGYQEISRTPLQCVLKIERCIEYIQLGDVWKCKTCYSEYKLSSSGLCNECQVGYFKVQESSLICSVEIINCIEHDISSEYPKCMTCRAGYIIDSNYECNSCQTEYIEVSNNPLECAYRIDKCISYTHYEGEWLCNSCEEGYKLDNEMKCNSCADGYRSISEEVLECIEYNESRPNSEDDDNNYGDQSSEQGEEEIISQAQKEEGDMIRSVNTATTSIVMVSTSISGAVSKNSSTLIFYINTIKLLSYIQYLSINLPFEIKKEQGSCKKFMKRLNILSYVKIEDKNPSDYLVHYLDDENGFLPSMIYEIVILMLLFIMNAILYMINKYANCKIKNLTDRILNLFYNTLYIQFIMLTYIDFADGALIKIKNVRFI